MVTRLATASVLTQRSPLASYRSTSASHRNPTEVDLLRTEVGQARTKERKFGGSDKPPRTAREFRFFVEEIIWYHHAWDRARPYFLAVCTRAENLPDKDTSAQFPWKPVLMGRLQQRKNDRKRAAASCQSLDVMFEAKRQKANKGNGSTVGKETVSASVPSSSISDPDRLLCASFFIVYLVSCLIHLPVVVQTSTRSVVSFPTRLFAASRRQILQLMVWLPLNTRHLLRRPFAPVHENLAHDVDIGTVVASLQLWRRRSSNTGICAYSTEICIIDGALHASWEFWFPLFLGGCNRCFRRNWLVDHKWLSYSKRLDGGFCIPCALFNSLSGKQIKGKFVTKPFKIWRKKSEQCKGHETLKYHESAMELADNLIQNVENPETGMLVQADKLRAANVEKNRALLKPIIRAVLYCARQCIALRGDSETLPWKFSGPSEVAVS